MLTGFSASLLLAYMVHARTLSGARASLPPGLAAGAIGLVAVNPRRRLADAGAGLPGLRPGLGGGDGAGLVPLMGFAPVLLLPHAPRLAVWLPAGGGVLWVLPLGAGLWHGEPF